MIASCLQQVEKGVVVQLQVQPRASRNQILDVREGALRIKLTSPPVDGAANKCCREFLAKLFGVAKGRVELVGGEKARQKRILLHELDYQQVLDVLSSAVTGGS